MQLQFFTHRSGKYATRYEIRDITIRHSSADGILSLESHVSANASHTNQPFGRFASAQIEMKVCRQTAAFLVELA